MSSVSVWVGGGGPPSSCGVGVRGDEHNPTFTHTILQWQVLTKVAVLKVEENYECCVLHKLFYSIAR